MTPTFADRGGCFENALHGMREERGLVHHATVLALRQSLHPGLCRITTWIRDARGVVEGALEAGVGVAYDSWRAPEGVGEASDVDLGDAKCQCTTVEAADASAEAADIPVDGLVGVANSPQLGDVSRTTVAVRITFHLQQQQGFRLIQVLHLVDLDTGV